MKPAPWLDAEQYRRQRVPGYESRFGDRFGVFVVPYPPPRPERHFAAGATVVLNMLVVAGELAGKEKGDEWVWDHVSVALAPVYKNVPNRCPTWSEMSFVKSLFWDDTETVMQLHVPTSEHINLHPSVLHLWKPLLLEIPRPPGAAVGVPGGIADNKKFFRQMMRVKT